MRLGIGSWTYGWAVGVSGYPRPTEPLTCIDLVDRARSLGANIVQFGDNLPVHELSTELKQLREHAARSGITIELGTVGVEREHLRLYLELPYFSARRLFVL